MKKNSRIFIAGHTGMVGSAIHRNLLTNNYDNIVTRKHLDLPLDDESLVEEFFCSEKPEFVFLAAAKVGGISANNMYGSDFIRENLRIQTNVIDAAYRHGTKRLLFLGSSCIYPKTASQPIREDAFLTGPLEETNLPYAVAKIAGKVMCDAYRKQHGFDAFTIMPCNVYGIGDNFHPENSHIVAGLMRRFHEAKEQSLKSVDVWGTGNPLRELIFADDLAEACIFLMLNYSDGNMINIGTSDEISVKKLAQLMAEVTNYRGQIRFDNSRPDGTLRKLMDNTKISSLGWKPKVDLHSGLEITYRWWLAQKNTF